MTNPHEPPRIDPAGMPPVVRWWHRVAVWLAWVEILGGLALGFGGCAASLASDASLALVSGAAALCASVVFLVLPGLLLLFGRHPWGWIGQGGLLALVAYMARGFGHH